MYKDKEKQKEANRERKRRQRDKGVTLATKGVTKEEGVTVTPDMLDKLTDPTWRDKLEKICQSFQGSHHPDYINDVWLGDYNMSQVCDLLEVTR